MRKHPRYSISIMALIVIASFCEATPRARSSSLTSKGNEIGSNFLPTLLFLAIHINIPASNQLMLQRPLGSDIISALDKLIVTGLPHFPLYSLTYDQGLSLCLFDVLDESAHSPPKSTYILLLWIGR